ncbi:MAG: hypothetical protein ACRC62_25375, partial [Microcoleus sp.]
LVGLDVFLTIKRRREKLLEYLEGRSRYPLQDSDAQTILLAISVGASPYLQPHLDAAISSI